MHPVPRSRILVVDDDVQICAMLERALRHPGYDVVVHHEPLAAAREIVRRLPDLLIVDLMLPGMSGAELVESVSRSMGDKTPPALLITGAPERLRDEDRALFARVFTKPFRIKELLEAVRSALGEG